MTADHGSIATESIAKCLNHGTADMSQLLLFRKFSIRLVCRFCRLVLTCSQN